MNQIIVISTLKILHNATTLFFGIFVSAFFLGVRKTRKNIVTLLLFFSVLAALFLSSFLLIGENATTQIYPLLIHIPLIIFLILYYKYRFISACTSVFSAYLCCQISNWAGIVIFDITGSTAGYYIVRIITTTAVFYILSFKLCHTMEILLNKEIRDVFIVGLLPFSYYIFDYAATKFSNLLYSGNKSITEFMGFAFCLSYLLFLLFYVREYENKMEIRQYSNLMELQLQGVQKEVEYVNDNKKKLSIMKHDMRHQLHIIQAFLEEGHMEHALQYIREVDSEYEKMNFKRYCKNELLNSVISIYKVRFETRGFSLQCNISTQEKLPCPDIALCTVLSNALENSMHALEKMTQDNKWADLKISMKGDHLLLELKNPIETIPPFVDGIPVSKKEGHGIGVKSIVYYVEQMNGQYHFSVTDHVFILRIIIGGLL